MSDTAVVEDDATETGTTHPPKVLLLRCSVGTDDARSLDEFRDHIRTLVSADAKAVTVLSAYEIVDGAVTYPTEETAHDAEV